MDEAMTDVPLFRPVKQRKFLRKRPEDKSSPTDDIVASAPSPHSAEDNEMPSSPPQDPEIQNLSVSEILRLRKRLKSRKVGIEFSNTQNPSNAKDGDGDSQALMAHDHDAHHVPDISDRFTPHTGQIVDANKHMMEFIESELSKRREAAPSSSHSDLRNVVSSGNSAASGSRRPVQKQPASIGKLMEVDLGPDSKLKNIARTEAAARRLGGEDVPDEDKSAEKKPRKPRLGPNGKPWRPRKRRNSEDLQRDRLVEEVLRESKLEIYDAPEDRGGDDDQAADDRIAEQFRRDFMEALHSRRHRAARKKHPRDVKKFESSSRGPKLGGSRSARAAMHKMKEAAKKG